MCTSKRQNSLSDMSIQHLTATNFYLSQAGTKKTLNINIPGSVLLLCKMPPNRCANSAHFEPVFGQLSRMERRVSFAMVDLLQNTDVVKMARQSAFPITATPSIYLYVNGTPFAKFKGTRNINSIQSFITSAMGTKNYAQAMRVRQYPPMPTPMQRQPQFAPQAARQAARGGHMQRQAPSAQPKVYMPESGNAPNLSNFISGSYTGMMQGVDQDDDDRLTLPDAVIPHNVPWEGDPKITA